MFCVKNKERARQYIPSKIPVIVDDRIMKNYSIDTDYLDERFFLINLRHNILNHRYILCSLKRFLSSIKTDFIVYTKNEQTEPKLSISEINRELKIGYTSASGIDPLVEFQETMNCLRDLFNLKGDLAVSDSGFSTMESRKASMRDCKGSFSLIFDVEQLGGVKFGLPRILGLLKHYDVQATFFVTTFMVMIYRDLPTIIRDFGHEIGIHGLYHEYLSKYTYEEQLSRIKLMIKELKVSKINGANFIGRMNYDTVKALTACGIRYFVHPFNVNYFDPRKITCRTILLPLELNLHRIKIIPIHIETYGRSHISIKYELKKIFDLCRKIGIKPHFNILLHPFRDGSMRYIKYFYDILMYILKKLNLQPLSLENYLEEIGSYTLAIEIPSLSYSLLKKNIFSLIEKIFRIR